MDRTCAHKTSAAIHSSPCICQWHPAIVGLARGYRGDFIQREDLIPSGLAETAKSCRYNITPLVAGWTGENSFPPKALISLNNALLR